MAEEEQKERIDIGDAGLSSNSRTENPEDSADFPAIDMVWSKILGDIIDAGKYKLFWDLDYKIK